MKFQRMFNSISSNSRRRLHVCVAIPRLFQMSFFSISISHLSKFHCAPSRFPLFPICYSPSRFPYLFTFHVIPSRHEFYLEFSFLRFPIIPHFAFSVAISLLFKFRFLRRDLHPLFRTCTALSDAINNWNRKAILHKLNGTSF